MAMPTKRDSSRLGGIKTVKQDPHHKVAAELSERHPKLARLVELTHPLERRVPDERPLTHLAVRTIVSQLVSTAAARSIIARLMEAHGSIEGIVEWAMATPDDDPHSHALSRSKRKSIAHWGRFVAESGDPRERWAGLSADELVAEIVKLRGFGPWSAHMLAIFGFGHPGIWPSDDAGVMRAANRVFKGMKPATVARLIKGHETHVAICCWSVLDRGVLEEF